MRAVGIALATFFAVVQFYTSLAALSPTPPVGDVLVNRAGAAGLVLLLVACALTLLVAAVREGARPAGPSAGILALWIGSTALSAGFGLAPLAGFQVVGIMLLTAVFHLALVRWYGRGAVAFVVLRTYLVVGALASGAAIVMALSRRPVLLWALNHGRATGVFVTANQCAAFLVAFVFVALGVALGGDARIRRLGLASAGVGGVALAGTVSFAGLIGAAAGAVYYAAMLGARRTAVGLGLGVALCAGALAAVPAIRHNPAESLDRLRIWEAGIRVSELFPLTGAGPMAYFEVYPAIRPANGDLPGTFGALHPHDVYLSLAGETGLVGVVAAAAGWLRLVAAFRRGVRALDPAGRRFAFGVAAALVAVAVEGLFDTVGVVELAFVWIPYTGLALAAASAGLPARAGGGV